MIRIKVRDALNVLRSDGWTVTSISRGTHFRLEKNGQFLIIPGAGHENRTMNFTYPRQKQALHEALGRTA